MHQHRGFDGNVMMARRIFGLLQESMRYAMRCRNLAVAALFAAGLAGVTGLAESRRGETVAVDNGIAVKESDMPTPTRGMTMSEVASQFGAPVTKIPAVGKPPIARWEYPGFVVYFEHEHVIHSVIANS